MTEFVRLVAAMRRAQRDYFKTRRPSALELAKDLERQVDEAVVNLHEGAVAR